MARVITFRSARLDVTSEPPNPINPIPGESVLRWLREQLRGSRYETTEPATEDWGWYAHVDVPYRSKSIARSARSSAARTSWPPMMPGPR